MRRLVRPARQFQIHKIGVPVSTAPPRQRAEERIPQRLFVRLYLPDMGTFEMAQTIDISRHGACVSFKKFLEPNQHLMLRSLRGHFTAFARVAHCEATSGNSYCLGLELYNPIGDWTAANALIQKTA
jgi:PilZ domain